MIRGGGTLLVLAAVSLGCGHAYTGDEPDASPSEGGAHPGCPTPAPNEKGIGGSCTKGGGQCKQGTGCDLDFANGSNFGAIGQCITVNACTLGNHDCGSNASCCASLATVGAHVCFANPCLPTGCSPE